jgi:hypothetical protein
VFTTLYGRFEVAGVPKDSDLEPNYRLVEGNGNSQENRGMTNQAYVSLLFSYCKGYALRSHG